MEKLETYTDIIEQNAEHLAFLKEKAMCVQNNDNSWTVQIKDEDEYQGQKVSETRELHIQKELAEGLFKEFLEFEMRNEALYYLCAEVYRQEHPDFDYQKLDSQEKSSFKRKAIKWFNGDEKTKELKNQKLNEYIQSHHDELAKIAKEKLLKDKIVEQVILNYGTSRTIENTGMESYLSSNDIGHCSKSVLTYMYGLQKQNGGFVFLPENPNIAAQPEKLFEHFHENYPLKTEQTKDIAKTFQTHAYEKGALALINNGHGRHLMMYQGLNNKGEPEFLGFNPLAQKLVLINQKEGEIIDIPSLIKDEQTGHIKPPSKQIDIEKLQTTEHDLVTIDMTLERTVNGTTNQHFENKVEIPSPIHLAAENMIQKTNEEHEITYLSTPKQSIIIKKDDNEADKMLSLSGRGIDKYGRALTVNVYIPQKDKEIYTIEKGAELEFVLDEQRKTCMIRCQDKLYPLFDEKNGHAEFIDTDGNSVYYDNRIPVKEGQEPILEELEGKYIIKFGKNHAYHIPYESENGEIYTQMKYDKGSTINISSPRAIPIDLDAFRAKLDPSYDIFSK